MTLQKLNNLRGLFALEIIVGHVLRYEAGLLQIPGRFMICSVAFFFFVSAYGMYLSWERNEKYLSGRFWLRKPAYLLALAILTYLFGCAVDLLIPNQLGYAGTPVLVRFWERTNWYLWEMALFYILFWLVFRFAKRGRVLVLSVVTLVAAVAASYLNITMAWVASALAFPLGLAFAANYDAVMKFLRSPWGIVATVALAVFGCGSLMIDEGVLSEVFMRNAICFAAIVITLHLSEWKFLHNPVFRFVGKYSTELYLAQFIWLDVAESCGWHWPVRLVFVPVVTFATAVLIFHPLVQLLRRKVFR